MLCILWGSSPGHQQQTAAPGWVAPRCFPAGEPKTIITSWCFQCFSFTRQLADSMLAHPSFAGELSFPPKLSQASLKNQAPVPAHTKWGRNESWLTVGCCQILASIYFIENMGSHKNVSARMLYWWSNQCDCFICFRWTSKNIWLHLVCWAF